MKKMMMYLMVLGTSLVGGALAEDLPLSDPRRLEGLGDRYHFCEARRIHPYTFVYCGGRRRFHTPDRGRSPISIWTEVLDVMVEKSGWSSPVVEPERGTGPGFTTSAVLSGGSRALHDVKCF